MYLGSKQHMFGEERHQICCRMMSIIWKSQILEVNDQSQEAWSKIIQKPQKDSEFDT